MEPGFHLLYARRLAWRHRLLLAIPLALLGFLHPFFALASLLPLLLLARLWEGRALREIARASLAYPTALAYGEERLWQEARQLEIPLPPFPLGLLALYLLLMALALGSWTGPPPRETRPFWSFPGAERPATPQGSPNGGEPGEAPGSSPGETAQTPASPGGAQKAEPGQSHPSPTPQEGKALKPSPQEPPPPSPQAPGQGTQAPRDGEGEPRAAKGVPGQEPGEPKGAGAPTPGTSGPSPTLEAPAALPLPEPTGPEEELLKPGREGKGQGLPSPWREGSPPEEVRRGVEVYLERTPLSPEAKELLRRYFSGP
ncbi:MAG: hypothetical protein ACK4ZX_06535 [Thermus sp.]